MRRFLITLSVLLLGAGAFFAGLQWRDRQAAAPGGTVAGADAPDSTPAAPPDVAWPAADAARPGPAPEASAAVPWPDLPPPDAPVAQHFDELADRARRGDANAACRLAVDLQQCRRVLGRRELAANLQDQAARRSETPDRLVEFIANLEAQQEQGGDRCEGVRPAQLASAYEFQRQAAMARPEMRLWFALDPALERREFVNELERWADYRRLAMPWLEAAAREGHVGALIALARVHGDLRRSSPPFPPFRIADDVRTVAYSDLLQRYGADFEGVEIGANQARSRLDAEGQARAAELADSLYRPDAPRPSATALRALMQRTLEPLPASMECEAVATR